MGRGHTCRPPGQAQAYRKVLRVLSTVAMCRYSRWLPSDSTSDSWPFSSSLLRLERGFFLRTEPRVRRSRHARIMWARSCWSRWKFSLQETHLNACPINVSQLPPPRFRCGICNVSRRRNPLRRRWRWQFVVFSLLTCQPVGCLCALALKRHTFTVFCIHRSYSVQMFRVTSVPSNRSPL